MHTIRHSISNFYISLLGLNRIFVSNRSPSDKSTHLIMQRHTALRYIYSHSIFMAVVIFSPFLLTNKIVIIEGITLSCEPVFKWHLKSFSLLPEQVGCMPKGLLSLREGLVRIHILVYLCMTGWVCEHI